VVRTSAIAGPSGHAWKTVAAAVAGKGVAVAELESFGLAATLPCDAARAMETSKPKLAAAFGEDVKCLDTLVLIRKAIDTAPKDPAAAAAAAVEALGSISGLAGPAAVGMCRSVTCTALSAALNMGMYDAEATAKAVGLMGPLFKALVARVGKAGPIAEAVGLWAATRLATGDLDEAAFGGKVFGELIKAGALTTADAKAWAAGAKGRSEKVVAIAGTV